METLNIRRTPGLATGKIRQKVKITCPARACRRPGSCWRCCSCRWRIQLQGEPEEEEGSWRREAQGVRTLLREEGRARGKTTSARVCKWTVWNKQTMTYLATPSHETWRQRWWWSPPCSHQGLGRSIWSWSGDWAHPPDKIINHHDCYYSDARKHLLGKVRLGGSEDAHCKALQDVEPGKFLLQGISTYKAMNLRRTWMNTWYTWHILHTWHICPAQAAGRYAASQPLSLPPFIPQYFRWFSFWLIFLPQKYIEPKSGDWSRCRSKGNQPGRLLKSCVTYWGTIVLRNILRDNGPDNLNSTRLGLHNRDFFQRQSTPKQSLGPFS